MGTLLPTHVLCQADPGEQGKWAACLASDFEMSRHLEGEGSHPSSLEVQAAHIEVYWRAVV